MAKPTPAPAPARKEASIWLSFVLSGLVGAIVGSTATYFSLRPQLERAQSVLARGAAPATSAGGDHLPPAELTAGLAPAAAARTLGNFHYDHGNWPEAQRHYESAIKQGEDNPDVRTDLGNVYRFSGRPAEALAQYELAQRMNPQHEFSLFNQGGLFLEELRDPTRAVAVWKEYLARFPTGRNAEAARQLIAQASGAPLPAVAGPFQQGPKMPPGSAPTSPVDQRLLNLVNQAPKKN